MIFNNPFKAKSKIWFEWSFGRWYNSDGNAGGFRIYKGHFEYWIRLSNVLKFKNNDRK